MSRKLSQLAVLATALALLSGAVSALSPSVPIRRAPAPLLAAGIPAFIALGGGAFVGRIVRRRKTRSQDA
jgi:hypothetical protein